MWNGTRFWSTMGRMLLRPWNMSDDVGRNPMVAVRIAMTYQRHISFSTTSNGAGPRHRSMLVLENFELNQFSFHFAIKFAVVQLSWVCRQHFCAPFIPHPPHVRKKWRWTWEQTLPLWLHWCRRWLYLSTLLVQLPVLCLHQLQSHKNLILDKMEMLMVTKYNHQNRRRRRRRNQPWLDSS